MMAVGNDSTHWKPGKRWFHADDIAISQMYIDLYRKEKRPEMLNATIEALDRFLKEPYPTSGKKDIIKWWWCDALFMAPPTLIKLGIVTNHIWNIMINASKNVMTYCTIRKNISLLVIWDMS